MGAKLIRVTVTKSGKPSRIVAELRIAGRLLHDAGIKAGDTVAVEAVGDGELRIRRVGPSTSLPH